VTGFPVSARGGRVAAHEADALRDVGDRIFPVVFVLHRDVAVEILAPQLVEDALDVGNAVAEGNVVPAGAGDVEVLEVAAEDAPAEDAKRVHRPHARADPVAGVGTGPDPPVPVPDERQDVVGVPVAIVRVVGVPGMVVDREPDVVLLDQPLQQVERTGVRLAGDGRDAHLPGELEDPAVRGLVGAEADHAEVHGADAVSVELGLEFGDVLVGQVLVEAHVAGVGAETLAGIELDHLAAGLGGLLDRLERGEAVEAIRLAADREPADAVGVRDALRGGARRGEE
jgi:hypothetical protein